MIPVPVFLYHSVTDDPEPWIAPYTVTPRVFTEQLDRIAASGLTVVPLRTLVAAQRTGTPLPERCAVLTFDDGYEDFYWTVAPLLAERDLPATLYITSGAIRIPGGRAAGSLLPPAPMLNWRQVATLDALGVEIGAHSRTHAQLDTLPARRLTAEVDGCRSELEDAVGHSVRAFAYPHGYSSATVRRKVARSGFTSATAVANAFSSNADQPLRIARLMVMADTPGERFRQWTEGRGAQVAPFPEHIRTKGWRAYRRLRAALGSPIGGPSVA